MHPDAIKKMVKMTQAPVPLKYKLQEIPKDHDIYNEPLGNVDDLPFRIERTWNKNLPVYSIYKNGGMNKSTIINKVRGDIDEFKEELSKIVSNSEIKEHQGFLEVSGKHAEKVKHWLLRLGF